ncbi:ABC transporter ATP-binding protein [Corynebacterium halotolerans]|uniref:ABC transporter ATP-binding protein n=1 Tax=Corynebacterium halotolerans YIM 70093 = DSM 44683 TaxID=1121362 RepID=M1P0F2_9CORY|nr:ATP-binding cassette domain-containing protein [Corynebacterium halotolerans]AGF73260.1 ABC transporter ATP-binding protein [Corynebacterium halotolerans YIM 70093 = DSM 44683]
MSAALRFRDVAVRRGATMLVEDLCLDIPRGSHWAVLGPNGAGKSTMLKLAGGWLHPTAGTVDILGHRLGRVDVQSLRRGIGWVDPRQRLGDIPVHEAVLSGLTGSNGLLPRWEPSSAELERVGRLLALTGMAAKRERRWTQLSQGERARTLIARALVTEPELLLLDEPSTGLDLPGRERLLRVVDDLRARRPELTTVLVTHHVEEIAASTSDVAMIADGKVLAAGPVGQVLTAANLSRLYGLPVRLGEVAGRWFAHA